MKGAGRTIPRRSFDVTIAYSTWLAVTILQKLFKWTFNNVWFGISLMLLTALYVAIGSGRPDVREFFEMDELKFFNAWPLKLLMWLLVLNLTTVTFLRIPFTKPRYGVWMV